MRDIPTSRMISNLRVLPVLIIFAIVLLGAKAKDIAEQFTGNATAPVGQPAFAQDSTPIVEEEALNEEATTTALPDADSIIASPTPPTSASLIDITEFSSSEISLLQSLRDRRELLIKQEAELKNRERVLLGLEQRINGKLEEMKAMQDYIEGMKNEIAELSTQFRKNEDDRIKSLVRVYERMKPKEAARIFDNLELTILLDVVKGMNESRLAPILADMDPNKATIITTKLGRREMLPTLEN
jgi:flagellar motility protein MotE (MotC chaperone)